MTVILFHKITARRFVEEYQISEKPATFKLCVEKEITYSDVCFDSPNNVLLDLRIFRIVNRVYVTMGTTQTKQNSRLNNKPKYKD
jgi:hypothetical protein